MRKKIDPRVRTLIENCTALRHRSLFVVVGDKGRDQVVNLHYMLSKAAVKARPSVLWCYKKDLHFSSHKKKRMRQIKKQAQRGLLDAEREDPFALFVASTNIRYTYYKDTHKVLGNTYGMCVLQDFDSISPNLLARTIETVEGGGAVVLLVSTLTSLTQLYHLTMDVHSRLKTESHQVVRGRFNERMVLLLSRCENCILCDDELNILPTSSRMRDIAPVEVDDATGRAVGAPGADAAAELADVVQSLADAPPAGPLAAACRTLDQAKALLTFLDAASEKTLRGTVALTAARGRGKSAALGLAIAGAVALGYSNIFVTAPTPENLRTLFAFVFKGLDALEFKEHLDYDLVESTNPAFGKAIVRVNVYKSHRQTIQYLQPQHHSKLGQAELLVIDEAAAIPLPLVKAMLGPYLVFLSSTVNGYEGTGRSLSLKLISQLRERNAVGSKAPANASSGPARTLTEVSLDEPIRYGPGDPIEAWLADLLCLHAADHSPRVPPVLPHPDECELFYVERDTLFSAHRVSEIALQRLMSLYVASHYKNTPNDLQMLSDAPAHHLFALTAPVLDPSKNHFPDILVVIQVALEGGISRDSAQSALASGQLPQGDLLPWMVGQQFQDGQFPRLSGARIVRIATHPGVMSAGYGSKAVQELQKYFEGGMTPLTDSEVENDASQARQRSGGQASSSERHGADGSTTLHSEQIVPRDLTTLPPLFTRLDERPAERLHYLGVSFGLTPQLLKFWRRLGFSPLYLRQTASEVTSEHTCIVIKALKHEEVENMAWVAPLNSDFCRRLIALLPGAFKGMEPSTVLSLLQPKLAFSRAEEADGGAGTAGAARVTRVDGEPIDAHDLKRLQAYCNNIVDHHMVLDLAPALARAFFAARLPVTQTAAQAAILVALGLQQRDLSAAQAALDLPGNQVLALFSKSMKRFTALIRAAKEEAVARDLPDAAVARRAGAGLVPHEADLDEELEQGAAAVTAAAALKAAAAAEDLAPDGLELAEVERYAVRADDAAFAGELRGSVPSGVVQVKSAPEDTNGVSTRPPRAEHSAQQKSTSGKKRKGRAPSGRGANAKRRR